MVSPSSKSRFVTLAELCEMIGISKSRFYALQKKGIFPESLRAGNRPVFDQQLVETCLGVVRSRVGINGEPVLFNRKSKAESSKSRPVSVRGAKHSELITALQSLGITATPDQVEAALKTLPDGGKGMEEPAVIRSVFLHLKKSG